MVRHDQSEDEAIRGAGAVVSSPQLVVGMGRVAEVSAPECHPSSPDAAMILLARSHGESLSVGLSPADSVSVLTRPSPRAPLLLDVFQLDGPIIVTIDGPAGTGKSTVARLLAKRLGVDFLDTGAMYRAAAALSIDRGIADERALVELVRQANIRFDWKGDPPTILAFGIAMGARIRDKDVTARVSPISAFHDLRELMVQMQRQIAIEHPRLVTEGRDQGSVVFPDATVKFYLDADPAERARRRVEQLRDSGRFASPADVDVNQVLAEIVQRDERDQGRPDGPLLCPDGAVVVDTTYLSQDEVVQELDRVVRSRAILA